MLNPLLNFNVHRSPVEDVHWHKKKQNLFGSVSEDSCIFIWDIKENSKTPICQI